MILFTDYGEFFDEVGRVIDLNFLISEGLTPEDTACNFRANKIDALLDFCKKHPEYHIITMLTAETRVNKYIPGHNTYQLGNGNADENIYHSQKFCPKESAKLLERYFREAISQN